MEKNKQITEGRAMKCGRNVNTLLANTPAYTNSKNYNNKNPALFQQLIL